MTRRRGRRPPSPRRGPQAGAQLVSVIFLAVVLVFILRFKEHLAHSLSNFVQAFSPDVEGAEPNPGLDIPTLPEDNPPAAPSQATPVSDGATAPAQPPPTETP